MRILSIGNFYNPSWDSSIPDEEHIAGALEELGHEVTRWQREDVVEQSNKFISIGDTTIDVDFVLIAQWDRYPSFDWLKVPKVYWAFDYQADGQEWHERLIAESDLYLSKRIADSKYPNWQWLSQDFAPSFLDRYGASNGISPEIANVPKDIDVLFTGSWLDWAGERNATLQAVDHKFNLVIHTVNSQSWPGAFKHVHGPIMDHDLPRLYARARVILSIDHTIEAGYHSDRVAQALCCGGFVLHRYVPMDEVSFKNNVVYFYNTIDCLDKVQYYLNRQEQRENTSNKGYQFAQSNMKVTNRVQDLLIIVESLVNEKDRTHSRSGSLS